MLSEKKAYAKINLTLDLTCVLPDRYHGIFTVMQSVGLYDTVTVETVPGDEIILVCSDPNIPCDSRNTAYKAASYFFNAAGKSSGLKITVEKNIPSQAGLAGGSADAAAVLCALYELFPGTVDENALYDIALRVGADVPFCLAGGTRLCQNKGEIMSALPHLKAYAVLVKPEENVSTKEAYMQFDSSSEVLHPDNEKYLFYAALGDYRKAAAYAANVFEELTDVYSGQEIKAVMYSSGAYYAAMSGSGSAFFGLFEKEEEAVTAAGKLREKYDKVFVCETKEKGTN